MHSAHCGPRNTFDYKCLLFEKQIFISIQKKFFILYDIVVIVVEIWDNVAQVGLKLIM